MTKKITLGFAMLLVAIVAGALIYKDIQKKEAKGLSSVTVVSKTVENTPGGERHEVSASSKVTPSIPPALTHSDGFKNTLAPETRTLILAQADGLLKTLKDDPKNIQGWITLGVDRKALGDYVGARDVWEYAKVLDPKGFISWNNLGDLYHFYLKDYKRSEENWKMTIVLDPSYIQGYRGLVELYKYSMPEKQSEIPVLLKGGIEKNPSALDLMVMLAQYYQNVGSTAEAQKAYDQAITTADRVGNSGLSASLRVDREKIK